MPRTLALVGLSALALAAVGLRATHASPDADGPIKKILSKYDSFVPGDGELALFKLDWVKTLKEARKKAASEGRPILLLSVENEHGGFYTGHC